MVGKTESRARRDIREKGDKAMTVFIRNKDTGKETRYALIGNVSIEGGAIILAKDPRISATIYRLPATRYEIARVTATELETPETVKAWTDGAPREWVETYTETVFGREM